MWDDAFYVVSNKSLQDWSNLPAYFYDSGTSAGHDATEDFRVFRPLRNVSYLIDYSLAGLNPAWWHIHQVLLHTLNALLVAIAAGLLARSPVAALVGGLLFLVHPVQTEVVAWVKGRDDALSACWTLIGFLLWLHWRGRAFTWPRCAALSGVYLVACLAKDQAIILPLLLLTAERWLPPPAPDRTSRAGLRLWASLAATGLLYLVWRHLFIGRTSQVDYLDGPLSSLLTMLPVAVKYLQLLICPWHLLADYAGITPATSLFDPRVLGAIVVLALVTALIWRVRKRAPFVTFGLLWVGLALLPVSNIVPMMQYMAERFLYLPMIGFACAAGALAAFAVARWRLPASLACAILLALAALRAHARTAVWQNDVTLFTTTVRDTPANVLRARRSLMSAYMRAGQYAQARPIAEELWRMAETAPDLSPRKRAEYTRHFGMTALRSGDRLTGRAMLEKAIAHDPTYLAPYVTLGIDAGAAGDAALALDWLDRAQQIDPQLAVIHYNRGIALQALGDPQGAELAMRQAIALHPETPDMHKTLAAQLWQRNDIPAALQVYRDAAQRWPNDPEIVQWLVEAERLTQNHD
ncbi:MAG: tetratricopeptide repeat protein [Verrucomicrobia bacterium]|nr:tetratricopeptide repeat protein [Verrucomicrobiota bacterium]